MIACDFCGSTAKYDGKTTNGYWANMCGGCFGLYGYPDIPGYFTVLRQARETKPQKLDYDEWFVQYESILIQNLEMGSDDLPDIFSAQDAYDEGLSPKEAAEKCIGIQMSEMGF